MQPNVVYQRYQELQSYVGWTDDDVARINAIANDMAPYLPQLVDDFYAEIDRHPLARAVITGGEEQIARLKGSLLRWLQELLNGPYDADYALRRWRVGMRHVEIGLDQVYTNVALSRMRAGLIQAIGQIPSLTADVRIATVVSLNKLIDLDLAKIEDAYQAEYLSRQQRVERLAAIGQIAGGVAHELRNPLNVVQTSVYYLLNARSPSAEKTLEHLNRIKYQIGVADGVITTLTNFAKMPAPNLDPFPVRRPIQEALEIEKIASNIEIKLLLPDDLPKALGDEAQVRIVFSNLIRNARDAMSKGGCLTIRGSLSGARLEVSVEDTGVGIEPGNLERIMEPFNSTKARGLGLGLALSRAILEKNKGTLRATSQLGAGSTFTVSLLAEHDH